MIVYWLLFLLPACALLTNNPSGSPRPILLWRLFAGLLVVLIGFRYRVGGDWEPYLQGFQIIKQISSWDEFLLVNKDFAYSVLNWVSARLGMGIYGVNFICAAIFVVGLLKLARQQPYPWLAVVIAVPYLAIVVAMGYTRQAAALGCLMYGFSFLLQNRLLRYLLMVLIASLFHKTACLFSVFILFRPGSTVWMRILGSALLCGLVAGVLLAEQAEILIRVYVEQKMESSGGQIRVLMNLPPALTLFVFWKKWGKLYSDRWLWSLIAVLAIACIPLVDYASTAVDRMALYLTPLQLVVWARLPDLLRSVVPRIYVMLGLVSGYAIIQYVWLNYASHAFAWVPYNNLLFPF